MHVLHTRSAFTANCAIKPKRLHKGFGPYQKYGQVEFFDRDTPIGRGSTTPKWKQQHVEFLMRMEA